MIGGSVSHFRVTAKLGQGGMGEVYLATDTRLGREVALKVLPEAFARDPERLARFSREARVLASLHHPGIAQIHGLEEADGRQVLVLELVPGDTLAERLARGALPLDETLRIALGLVEAVEAAHAQGVVHRDLKPANVKVGPDGEVKVLDFGLAKALAPEAEGASADLTHSPTLSAGTALGALLGTAAYMSPEQARGRPVDTRTDVWAFGCILYEMLAGRPAFAGETATDVLAAVVTRDPDWDALPGGLNGRLLSLLKRTLAKEPRRRLHHLGDARLELEEIAAGGGEPGAAPALSRPVASRRAARVGAWAAAFALLLAAAAVLAWALARRPRAEPARRVSVLIPAAAPLTTFPAAPQIAVSPDGEALVYTATVGRSTQLFLRPLASYDAQPIAGTDGGHSPFFSPDGEWIGYFAGSKLKKVPRAGGTAQTICPAVRARGASWGADGNILVSMWPGDGLVRVPAGGGTPVVVAAVDDASGELPPRLPQLLPDGEHAIVTVLRGEEMRGVVERLRLRDGARDVLVEDAMHGRYLESGHLLWVRGRTVFAAPFDAAAGRLQGDAVAVLENVESETVFGSAQLEVGGGVIAWAPHEPPPTTITWLRDGTETTLPLPPLPWYQARPSPDGSRVALAVPNDDGVDEIWLHDVASGGLSRWSAEGGSFPVWSPAGDRLAFRDARGRVVVRALAGGADEVLLPARGLALFQAPDAWSPDGKTLLIATKTARTDWDLWRLDLAGGGEPQRPRPLLVGETGESAPAFSPDGRWLVYSSFETGRPELYVQAFPGGGDRRQLTFGGGDFPAWIGDELYFCDAKAVLAMPVTSGSPPSFGAPRRVRDIGVLVDWMIAGHPRGGVLLQQPQPRSGPGELRVILGAPEALHRQLPASR